MSRRIFFLAMGGAFLVGCAAPPATKDTPPTASQQSSILVSSTPAANSLVPGPVNELKLSFDPPARLDEVIVTGSAGMMPMMVHAVGEVRDYSVPLPGLGSGNYVVNWKASVGGRVYDGSFPFTVK